MSPPAESVRSGDHLAGRKGLRRFGPRWNLSLLAQSSVIAFVEVDPNRQVAASIHGADRLFGCAASDVVDQPLSRLLPRLSETERQQLGALAEAARFSGDPLLVLARRKNGTGFPIEAHLSKQIPVGKQGLL